MSITSVQKTESNHHHKILSVQSRVSLLFMFALSVVMKSCEQGTTLYLISCCQDLPTTDCKQTGLSLGKEKEGNGDGGRGGGWGKGRFAFL